MEDLSDEFTSMSFGQKIRKFLWDNKISIFFASLSAVLVVYMMKQRSEHIKVLEECTVLKAKHNTELMILNNSIKSGNCTTARYLVNVDLYNTIHSQHKELRLMFGKLISLTTK